MFRPAKGLVFAPIEGMLRKIALVLTLVSLGLMTFVLSDALESSICINSKVVTKLVSVHDGRSEVLGLCASTQLVENSGVNYATYLKVSEQIENVSGFLKTIWSERLLEGIELEILNDAQEDLLITSESIRVPLNVIGKSDFEKILIHVWVKQNFWIFNNEPVMEDILGDFLFGIHSSDIETSKQYSLPVTTFLGICSSKFKPIAYYRICRKYDGDGKAPEVLSKSVSVWSIKPVILNIWNRAYLTHSLWKRHSILKAWVAEIQSGQRWESFPRKATHTFEIYNILTTVFYSLNKGEFGDSSMKQYLVWRRNLNRDHEKPLALLTPSDDLDKMK